MTYKDLIFDGTEYLYAFADSKEDGEERGNIYRIKRSDWGKVCIEDDIDLRESSMRFPVFFEWEKVFCYDDYKSSVPVRDERLRADAASLNFAIEKQRVSENSVVLQSTEPGFSMDDRTASYIRKETPRDARHMWLLGKKYESGWTGGRPVSDFDEAEACYKEAADMGLKAAMRDTERLGPVDLSVKKDYVTAFYPPSRGRRGFAALPYRGEDEKARLVCVPTMTDMKEDDENTVVPIRRNELYSAYMPSLTDRFDVLAQPFGKEIYMHSTLTGKQIEDFYKSASEADLKALADECADMAYSRTEVKMPLSSCKKKTLDAYLGEMRECSIKLDGGKGKILSFSVPEEDVEIDKKARCATLSLPTGVPLGGGSLYMTAEEMLGADPIKRYNESFEKTNDRDLSFDSYSFKQM